MKFDLEIWIPDLRNLEYNILSIGARLKAISFSIVKALIQVVSDPVNSGSSIIDTHPLEESAVRLATVVAALNILICY